MLKQELQDIIDSDNLSSLALFNVIFQRDNQKSLIDMPELYPRVDSNFISKIVIPQSWNINVDRYIDYILANSVGGFVINLNHFIRTNSLVMNKMVKEYPKVFEITTDLKLKLKVNRPLLNSYLSPYLIDDLSNIVANYI